MKIGLVCLSVIISCLIGCGLGSGSKKDKNPPKKPDTKIYLNQPEGAMTFDKLIKNYGNLSTIAGTGKIREKGENGWKSDYEGQPATGVELSRPHNALTDKAGNIYIADKDAHAVRKITPDGNIHTVAGMSISGDNGDDPAPGKESLLSMPNGIWVLADGTVYILDLGNAKIRKLSPDGQLSTLFKDPKGIEFGRGLWVSDDEQLVYYASGNELKKWTPKEGIKVISADFKILGNIAVSPKGELYATDREGSLVVKVSEDGSKEVVAGNGKKKGGGSGYFAKDTGLHEVRGIWFHPQGGYFLATHKGGQIWYVDTVNVIHLFVDGNKKHAHEGDGEKFNTPGKKISEPRAISMDYEGNILITENDHGFIRKIEYIGEK